MTSVPIFPVISEIFITLIYDPDTYGKNIIKIYWGNNKYVHRNKDNDQYFIVFYPSKFTTSLNCMRNAKFHV